MTLEERMLERFTRERQRASKGTFFNLDDDEDLTHYGQSLSKLDDFDNTGLGSESNDEETSGTSRCVFDSTGSKYLMLQAKSRRISLGKAISVGLTKRMKRVYVLIVL